MKIWRFGEEQYGKRSTKKAYQDEEQKELEITHYDDSGNAWLKSYGLTSWMIEPEIIGYCKHCNNAVYNHVPGICHDGTECELN